MFRKIRRVKNELPTERAKELLRDNRRAAFSVHGDDGYPYAVPVNFYYEESENKIYFHSAKAGHKLDAIRANDKVCFTTWDDGVTEPGEWAPYVCSCIAFGRAHVVTDRKVALEKIRKIALKYYPSADEVERVIEKDFNHAEMICIEIEHMSGKRIQER